MKSQYLESFTEKDLKVDSLFAVKKKNSVHPYKDGKVFMFSILISDKTDEMLLNYFGGENEEEVKSLFNQFENLDVIHVVGITNEYQGRINIIVDPDNGLIEKTEEYDLEDFLPMTKKDILTMVSELKDMFGGAPAKPLPSIGAPAPGAAPPGLGVPAAPPGAAKPAGIPPMPPPPR